MTDDLVTLKIAQYVAKVPLTVEECLNDRGSVQYLVSSDIGKDLRILSYPKERAMNLYKDALLEQLRGDYINDKPLPFSLDV